MANASRSWFVDTVSPDMIEITTCADLASSIFSQYMAVGEPIYINPTEYKQRSDPGFAREPSVWDEVNEGRIAQLEPKIILLTITEDCSPVKYQELSNLVNYITQKQESKRQYVVVSCPWVSDFWETAAMVNLCD